MSEEELREWARIVRHLLTRVTRMYGFANNRYSGHGPATLEQFSRLYRAQPEVTDGDLPF